MNLYLYHGNDEAKHAIGMYNNMDELHKAMDAYVKKWFGKSYYTRMWLSDEYVKYDYGSYHDFCYVCSEDKNPESVMKMYMKEG